MEVALNDVVIIWVYIVKVSSQEDSSTLAGSFGLYYEGLIILLLIAVLASVVWVLRWQ